MPPGTETKPVRAHAHPVQIKEPSGQTGHIDVPKSWEPVLMPKGDGMPVVVFAPPKLAEFIRDNYKQPEAPEPEAEAEVTDDPLKREEIERHPGIIDPETNRVVEDTRPPMMLGEDGKWRPVNEADQS